MDSSRLDDLENDLTSVPTVSFPAMLKGMLMRARTLSIHPGTSQTREAMKIEETKKYAEGQFKFFAESAVKFCNASTPNSMKLKEAIRSALTESNERQRTQHVVDGLNATLLAYHQDTIGDFVHQASDDDLIFVSNEYDSANGGTMVTVAGTNLRTLRQLSPSRAPGRNKSFRQWLSQLNTKTWKRARQPCHIPWKDIWHCFDVKATSPMALFDLPCFSVPDVLGSECRLDTPVRNEPWSASPTSRKRKRTLEDSITTSPKRRRSSTGSHIDLGCEIQYEAACNGLELLCSRWDRIHSLSVILQDNLLSLAWYDSQGMILTTPIDVITQLPFLVMTVAMLQRLSPQMRGIASFDLAVTLDGGRVPFDLPEGARPRWQLKGRHAVFATPIPRGTKTSQTATPSHRWTTRSRTRAAAESARVSPLKCLFFKLSWRDERRPSESVVISTAKERAEHYLPDPGYVVDHLPDVKFCEDYDLFSTRHIRQSLGLDTTGSRAPSVMVMRKLQPLESIEPTDFRDFIWQIIRCLRLLWQTGIAHGDLSFWNMMQTGEGAPQTAVLIDFDHAAIMEPGSSTPPSPDLERVGTRPFIALDMGRSLQAPLERGFRHDLESTLWCMLWYCQEQPAWLKGTFEEVCTKKQNWFFSVDKDTVPIDIRKGSEVLWKPIVSAAQEWVQADFSALDSPKTDREWLDIVNKHFSCPDELDNGWMSFEVPRRKIRRKDRSKS
ncbi:hypothetical protein BKA70DRAFT_1565962 [Coprinopsis sp. MPI-PUGE-AT-0042]|nr:hypothetical protein BKA70DRAFT_1565962 [Coprinopsis sp. MPI-PUGE-AT-0042]